MGTSWKRPVVFTILAMLAIEAGSIDNAVEAIHSGSQPALTNPQEALEHEVANALLHQHRKARPNPSLPTHLTACPDPRRLFHE